MFHVAICDDEVALCAQLENYLGQYASRGIVKTETFYSADKLYEALGRGEYYDLIFLDIEFEMTDGVEIGRRIRDELGDERVQIVYISVRQDYAMELFSVRPMNFLVKPVSETEVVENVDKAIALSGMNELYFEFKFRADNYRIPYGDIMYFESSNRKVYIHTKHGVKEMYGRLNEVGKRIPPTFIRVHQSYLVNRMYVTHWNSEELSLSNGCRLSVSQPYRKAMCRALMQNERRQKW